MTPVVLLIDEIDRVEVETEALLLEVLSDYQVSTPELGTVTATQVPLVFLTSNGTRELSEALKRRCLYLYLDYPSIERERAIVIAERVPGHLRRGSPTRSFRRCRSRCFVHSRLQKHPSISETLDWARTLVLVGDRARRCRHDDGDPQFVVEVQGRYRLGDQGALGHRDEALGVLDVLSGFLGELRAAGLPISLRESIDAQPRRPTLSGCRIARR